MLCCKLWNRAHLATRTTAHSMAYPLRNPNALYPLLLYSHELKLKCKDSLDSRIHVYFHFIWFETFTGFSWTARIHAQKPQIKGGTMDSLIYPSYRRLKPYSCVLVISISLEHQEKHFKTSHLYPIKWHVHLPWIPQEIVTTTFLLATMDFQGRYMAQSPRYWYQSFSGVLFPNEVSDFRNSLLSPLFNSSF